MSLSLADEKWVKNQKQITDLRKEIAGIQTTALNQITAKQQEIEAIRTQMADDIKVKEDAITVIENS